MGFGIFSNLGLGKKKKSFQFQFVLKLNFKWNGWNLMDVSLLMNVGLMNSFNG